MNKLLNNNVIIKFKQNLHVYEKMINGKYWIRCKTYLNKKTIILQKILQIKIYINE